MLDERDGTRERPDDDDPHPHTPSSTGADPLDGPSLPLVPHRTPQPAPGQPADASVGDAGPAPALSSGPARPAAPARRAPAVVPDPCAASRMEPGRGAARSPADDAQTGRAEADVAGHSAGASLGARRSPAPTRHRSPPSPPPGSPPSSSMDPLLSPGPSPETHNTLANRISISDTNLYNSDLSALTTDQPIEASMGETLPSALDARPSSPPSSVSASSLSSTASHIPPTSSSSPQPPPSSLPPPLPMQTLVDEPSTSASAHSRIQPRALLSLLCCPLCPPRTLLRSPVTLHCGHTICAEHLHTARSPPVASTSSASPAPAPGAPSAATAEDWATPCPLPTCSRPSPQEAPTFIHPDAHVGLIRPPAAAPFVHASDSPLHPHVDVTVNKLIDLVRRTADAEAQADQDHTRRVFGPGDDDDDRTDESDGAISEGGDEDEAEDDADCPGRAGPSSRARPHMNSPRPRKRRRLRHIPRTRTRPATPPRPPEARADTDADGETRFEKELKSELLCEICFAMMWQPVTTPCQHTFCSKCLQRALDHSNTCPLCREKLPGYVYFQEHSYNKLVLSIILKSFPEAYAERGLAIQAEERNARLNTPIFEIQLSFPGMPTILHFYEPRYRLMLRRCLATPHPSFGMIPQRPPSAGETDGFEYGTMLEIRNVQILPDGRSVVETWGSYRFRIMERGLLDGYVVGRIERVDDFEEELEVEGQEGQPKLDVEAAAATARAGAEEKRGEESEAGGHAGAEAASVPRPVPTAGCRAPTNQELIQICQDFVRELRDGTPWVNQSISNYVEMPTDPVAFTWWMAPLIPIEDKTKAKLLPIRSPRLRLRLIVHWIEQLRSQWARSYASASRWQVVHSWMYALLMPWALPLPVRWAIGPRLRAVRWVARVLLFAVVVLGQVHIYREQQRARLGQAQMQDEGAVGG